MKFARLVLALALSSGALVQAQTPPATKASTPLASGEIITVYPKEKKVLLKHGPIPSINMAPMTMEYGVKETKLLSVLKKGDKIRFTAESVGSDYVLTHIEIQK